MFSPVRVSRPVRAVLATVLAGGLAFGASACATSTTDRFYAPSDGVRERLDSGIEVQNLMFLSNGDGAEAVVGGAIKNFSDQDGAVRLSGPDSSFELIFEISAGDLLNFTADNVGTVSIESLDAKPGSTVATTFEDSQGNATVLNIPVLDGTLDEYAPLIP